jgi:aspartyl-tRNA(Asn)/glutamyl-tRNA(Gln) amidotransferase subunit A
MFFEGLDPEISTAVNSALDLLRTLSRSLNDVQLPSTGNLLREIMGPEGYAYHSRWLRESPEKYQPQTRERIVQFGTAVTAEAYVQARRQCDVLRREIRKTFADVDLLVTPTMAAPPSLTEPIEQSASLDPGRTRNTWPFDVLGLPAMTVPCGFTRTGLPIGLQIVGAPFAEPTVLAMAHAYERATDWHTRQPTLDGN